ncbi:MAG TPA: hypothetical protein VJV78_04405 [Polyangiales bacterium]|nr:hypothetical protein [Polyangiales bacterium]
MRKSTLCASALWALCGCADAGSAKEADTKDTPRGQSAEHFSFFVTSYAALQRLSGSQSGFGGDLRYGEADGLSGADKICREIAEDSLASSGKKKWRAFLSVTRGPKDEPVHAIDRIGEGPWYDRRGRLVAQSKADLMNDRPIGADPAIVDDLPNEDGVPNHAPDGSEVDNHDILTGTGADGKLYGEDWGATCHDWTSSTGSDGRPRVGHSWPRDFSALFRDGGMPPFPLGGMGGGFPFPGGGFPEGGFPAGFDPSIFRDVDGVHWISSLNEAGCAPGASLIEMGPPNPNNPTVGSGGGYGGIYCFALTP